MNLQFETAWQLHRFLSSRGVPYAIIGGIAVQRWGQPRLTRDVDLTILLPPGGEEPTLREIVAAFPARIEDAVAFGLTHRVLPRSRGLRQSRGGARNLPARGLGERRGL